MIFREKLRVFHAGFQKEIFCDWEGDRYAKIGVNKILTGGRRYGAGTRPQRNAQSRADIKRGPAIGGIDLRQYIEVKCY